MMVGPCHSHPSSQHGHHGHRHHHPHRLSRSGSESSREENEPYSTSSSSSSSNNSTSSSVIVVGGSSGGTTNNTTSSSDYSLTMSTSDMVERPLHRHPSTASLLDSIERRTQRTYRYGIGLVCVGATLNWLGFAQGTANIDPLRYLGVACVLTGSFCVCLAMCRWLSKPISVSGHHVSNLEEERSNGDVHVINVAVPMYVPTLHEEYRPTKPPDYEQIVAGDEAFPPPYDEAVKLRPSAFFGASTPSHHPPESEVVPTTDLILDTTILEEMSGGGTNLYPSQYSQPSPSQHHSAASMPTYHHHHHHCNDLSRALLLDHLDNDSLIGSSAAPTPTPAPTPRHLLQPSHHHLTFLSRTSTPVVGEDPPPAYEPSPRPSISSCSSIAPLIPTSTSRFDLPPSFSVRRIFGGGGTTPTSTSPRESPVRRRDTSNSNSSNNNSNCSNTININSNEPHLHEQVISEDTTLSFVIHQPTSFIPTTVGLQLGGGNSDNLNGNINLNNNNAIV